MTENLHPELGSGALREALEWALTKIEFPLVLDSNDDDHSWKGCPGCRIIWKRDMEHKPNCPYVNALALSLSSPIEPPATITPQMMSGVFAKSVSNTDTEHDHVYDHRIAAAEINKLLARPTPQASSEIREPQCDLVELRRIISGMMHTTGGTFKHWQIHDRWSYDERCLKCQLERAAGGRGAGVEERR